MSSLSQYPRISVIVPSFNQGQFIEETLISIIGQCYPNLEVIVIDGGSQDNTLAVIEKYAPLITYWHSRPDQGQADAINQGMSKSTGDILCWLNSDDLYLPGTLLDVGSRLSAKLEQNCLIYGGAIGMKQGFAGGDLQSMTLATSPFDRFTLTYSDFIVQPSAFWTRALWEVTGELNPTYHYALDWEWWIRASQWTDFEYVERFYSLYRYHPTHKTSTGSDQRRQEIVEIVKTYSSPYWADLYGEVAQVFPKLFDFVFHWKIPKRRFLLPFLFPMLAPKVKQFSDLYIALNLLR